MPSRNSAKRSRLAARDGLVLTVAFTAAPTKLPAGTLDPFLAHLSFNLLMGERPACIQIGATLLDSLQHVEMVQDLFQRAAIG